MKCAVCGMETNILQQNNQGAYVCTNCLNAPKPELHRVYNEKGFLLPDSLLSMSGYHAKLFPDGSYIFRIHDCQNGIRLRGELNTLEGVREAIGKVAALESALSRFRQHLEKQYDTTDYSKL